MMRALGRIALAALMLVSVNAQDAKPIDSAFAVAVLPLVGFLALGW